MQEDYHAKEAIQARRDRYQTPPGRRAPFAGQQRCRCHPSDWRQRGHLLSLATGVRRPEDQSGQTPQGTRNRKRTPVPGRIRPDAGQGDFAGGRTGKLLSPARRRLCVEHIRDKLGVSERRACQALGQHRSTQRKPPQGRGDEARLTEDIITLARHYGRYGYRKIAELLRVEAGWVVNDKRVEHIWRREGLKVPAKQPKRRRLWLADGSCMRLRAEHANHVWSYDFVEDRTHDGRKYRMLNAVDEFTRECLAMRVARRLRSVDVIEMLAELFMLRDVLGYIRSDNGPEFIADAVQEWIAALGAKTAYIAPGSPWENGYVDSFNARLRDELLR